VRFPFGGTVVDAQQPGLGAAQVTAQPWFGFQRPDELIAFAGGPGVRAVDEVAQVGDQVGPHDCVPFGLFGVVTDHEPLGAGPVVAVAVPAGSHVYLLDPQVARDGRVPAGPGQRRCGLGEGAP
jgi:hypothetical protein